MPDLRSLEVFVWVARLGSFRGAAERLHTTQPAVSQRVAALEEGLGVRLFDRHPRAAALTAKGRQLLDYAERMLHLRAEMVQAVAGPQAIGGVLRLGVAETIVHTWLARFVEQVHARHPGISLDIEVDVSPNLRNALVANEIDLAFLLGPVSEPRMVNHPLASYPLVLAASPALDLGPEPAPLEALLRFPIITYPKTTKPYIVLREVLRRPHLPAPRLYSSSSLSTIIRMTLDGIGVSCIPPIVIAPELAAGRLRVVRTQIDLPDLTFTATYPLAPDNGLAGAAAALACEVATQDR